MVESGSHRRAGGLQTKALAGVVAVLLAAAIVALVFVTNGSGNDNKQAGGNDSPSDVGRTSSAAPSVSASHSVDASATSKPAPSTSASTTDVPATRSNPAGGTSSTSKPKTTHASQNRSITYTVKKGDNLTVIAAWFHQHGYGKLYEKNKSVIGDDPNLIFPGEKITVSGAGMTTSG